MFETPLITSFNVDQKKIKRRSDKMGQTETGATGKRKIQFKYGWVKNSPSVSLKKQFLTDDTSVSAQETQLKSEKYA